MTELSIKGTVQYKPGPQGLAIAAPGVSVEIIQNRVLLASTEVIWSGRTDANGRFSGTTREWRRMITVGIGKLKKTVPDETEVLALTVRVKDYQGNPLEATVPFVYVPNLTSPPTILPWSPPLLGRVNGAQCSHPGEFAAKCLSAIEAKAPLRLEFFAPGPDFRRMERIIEPLLNSCLQSFGKQSSKLLQAWLAGAANKLNTLKDDKGAMMQSAQKSYGSFFAGSVNQGGAVVEDAPDIILAIVRALASGGLIVIAISVAVIVVTAEVLNASIAALISIIVMIATTPITLVVVSVTIIMNISPLIRAMSALFRSLGFADAANELNSTASWWDSNVSSQFWFQFTMLAVIIVCAVILIVVLRAGSAAQTSWNMVISEYRRITEQGREGYAILLNG